MENKAAVKLEITDIGSAGEGIGRDGDLVVFVPGAVPGDIVRAEITENKGRFAKGRLVCIEKPSPDRVEPDCPYFGKCGGCSLRNYSYPAQLRLKEDHVRESLRRIGGIEDPLVHETIGGDVLTRFRNKTEFMISKGKVGFYQEGSHNIVTVNDCLIQSEPAVCLAKAMQKFLDTYPKNIYRYLVVRVSSRNEVMAIVVVNKKEITHAQELADMFVDAMPEGYELVSLIANVNKEPDKRVLGQECVYMAGSRVLKDRIVTDLSTLETEVSPLSFYQVNPTQCSRLYSKVQEYAALTGSETVLDLYCGAGSIGLSMASKVARVIGVESVRQAIQDASRNAVLNNVFNIEFIWGKAEEVVPKRLQGVKADVVVLDPPRSGCDKVLLETVADIAPKKLIYVSCNPSTLARDVKILTELGFTFEEATPVDMFHFSNHVEAVSLLSGPGKTERMR